MSGQTISAIFAIGLGFGVGVLLFVPFVAISYRRRGRFSVRRALVWAAALVYFWAIWTYTLLPLPQPDLIQCVGAILDPLSIVHDVEAAIARPGNTLTDPGVLQLAFNVLLFMPLGFFLRVFSNRGVIVALLTGLGVSLAVETTQLTGVWGIYPCAYRFFDVGDLITNTTGAVLGSVIALLVPRSLRGNERSSDSDRPRPVTRGRRVLAMLCDWLGISFTTVAVGVVIQLVLQYIVRDDAAAQNEAIVSIGGAVVAGALWLIVTLATGGTVGDLAVRLTYRGGPLPVPIARVLRWAAGYGGLSSLTALGGLWAFASFLLMLVSVVLVFTTKHGRGLPGVVSGQQLTDSREPTKDAVTARADSPSRTR